MGCQKVLTGSLGNCEPSSSQPAVLVFPTGFLPIGIVEKSPVTACCNPSPLKNAISDCGTKSAQIFTENGRAFS